LKKQNEMEWIYYLVSNHNKMGFMNNMVKWLAWTSKHRLRIKIRRGKFEHDIIHNLTYLFKRWVSTSRL
jgi:hypothetical protein